jgi:hypothetical protein
MLYEKTNSRLEILSRRSPPLSLKPYRPPSQTSIQAAHTLKPHSRPISAPSAGPCHSRDESSAGCHWALKLAEIRGKEVLSGALLSMLWVCRRKWLAGASRRAPRRCWLSAETGGSSTVHSSQLICECRFRPTGVRQSENHRVWKWTPPLFSKALQVPPSKSSEARSQSS